MSGDFVQVQTTTEREQDARSIGRSLVERRLAACAQVVGPIRSTYRWEGQLTEATEWLCLLKTRGDLYARLEEALRSLHPYREPEILALPVIAGSDSYLDWLRDSTEP